MSRDDSRTILRGKETGQWLSAVPSTVNGTELAQQEFRDILLLRYAKSPGDLQSHCDGCGVKFSVRHGLDELSSTVGEQRRPQPFPPLRPAHVALALCFLAKAHLHDLSIPMTRLQSRSSHGLLRLISSELHFLYLI
jgi:hypothetical protein